MMARGVALGLGASEDLVSSPTFTLIQEYPGLIPMIHVDLYRLNSEGELATLGLQEYFGGNQVVFVEWADRFPQVLPVDHLTVHMIHHNEHSRTATLQGTGPNSRRMLDQLSLALQAL